jgi:hypothetical protein
VLLQIGTILAHADLRVVHLLGEPVNAH